MKGSDLAKAARENSTANPDALIEMHQVVKTFKNAAGEFTVLKGIDAGFRESEFVSVVGRSGSGKSTLLNMMTGIDHPTSGIVRVGNTILHTLSEGQMSVWRGKSMGIVFQFFQLLPMLTLLENVMLPMDFCDMYTPAERENRALALLAEVDLTGLEHKYPAAVSGGQQQSAAVARALANDPPILIADEPTGNLDTRTAELILEIFENQVARGKTVVMVTHDDTLAQRAARKLVISDGELVNEWLAKALPHVDHSTLLALHHAAEPQEISAGQGVAGAEGADQNSLVVVTRGQVEVLAAGKNGEAAVDLLQAGRLYAGSGQAGSEERKGILETLKAGMRGRSGAATRLRAAEGGAEVLVVKAEVFARLLAASPELMQAIESASQTQADGR